LGHNTARRTPAQAIVAPSSADKLISSSLPDRLARDVDTVRAITKIRERLAAAKYRCDHPTGKNTAYRGVLFDFASPAEGARLLYEKLGPMPAGASLDRIDPSGPYSLNNLRYASPTLQSVNRRVVLNGWRRRHASP
jgi:hypothetical protein